jgi:hypothetical protein
VGAFLARIEFTQRWAEALFAVNADRDASPLLVVVAKNELGIAISG